jgi:hypothetical protein
MSVKVVGVVRIIPRNKFDFSVIDVDELIMKYHEYHNLQKVSEYYGCDRHALSKWIKENNIDIKLKQKIPTDIQQKIIKAYNTTPSAELAEKYGLTISAVKGIWYRNELKGKSPRIYHILNEDFFSIQTNDMAYFCGLIGSDGCVYTSKDTRSDILSIILQQQDKYILTVLAEKLQTNKPIKESTHNNRVYCSLQISSQKICDDLKALGLNNRKTYGNTIANVNNRFMFDLIRGYIDGDGTIVYKNNRPRVSIVGYYSNMNTIKIFLEQFNIYTIIVKAKRGRYKRNLNNDDFVTLCFPNKTSIYCLLKLLYRQETDCYLPRKKQTADKIIQAIEQSDEIKNKQIITYYNYAVLKLFQTLENV